MERGQGIALLQLHERIAFLSVFGDPVCEVGHAKGFRNESAFSAKFPL